MEEPIETKLCPICSQQIEVSKFRMHDIGCSRQNYKCKECGACVAKADKEDHEEEEHTKITCENCAFSAIKFKYGDHETKCPKKPQPCDFCDKTIPFHDKQDHYQLCGSKTEQCSKCEGYVKLMDKKDHLAKNICA